MKKISLLLTIIISIFLSISNVYALDISIDNTSIFDKSNTITVKSVSSSNLTIIPNITFNNINDYVILKVKFKGKSLSNYNIKNISDNNNSEYIKTSYKYKDTLNDPIYITMKYDNGANSDSSLNNINIIMDLEDENGNDNQVVINNQSTNNTSNNITNTTVTKNPGTGLFSYIIIPIILGIISLILIRYYTKYKEDNTLMILILFLLVVPLSVMAYESYKLGIIIKTDNVIIKKSTQKNEESKPSSSSNPSSPSKPSSSQTTYVVYLYPNGGTGISEGQKFEYTETTPFSKFPSVSKTGCTLEGWNVDSPNGKEYYQNIDYTDNGRKLYARWNCNTQKTNTFGYENQEPIKVSLADLPCKINDKTFLYINPTISTSMKTALQRTCNYLAANSSIYNTPNIQTAGTWNKSVTTYKYPHYYAMGIDLFNEWKYKYNGKTYAPYGSYANSYNYRKFICEVCNGDYTCKQNLNYHIYEEIFKPLGYCWGGYWKEEFFDPMHFEYDVGIGNCNPKPQITIDCSKF